MRMLKKLCGLEEQAEADIENQHLLSAQYHEEVAKRYGMAAAAKLALSAMFTGFTGKFSEVISHTLIFGGGFVLSFVDIIPTLKEKRNVAERESKLLTAFHYSRKAVALVEGVAVVAVYSGQSLEIAHKQSADDTVTNYLIPSFATILLAKGTLGLLHNLVEAHKYAKAAAVMNTTIGPLTTLSQAGVIIAVLKQGVTAIIGNGCNATLSLGQSLAYTGMGLWNHTKFKEADQILAPNFYSLQEEFKENRTLPYLMDL